MQTVLEKQKAWIQFFQRKNPNSKVLDNLSNWQVVESHLEHKKLPWTAGNIALAIRENVDYIEFDRSAEVAQQRATQKAVEDQQTTAINAWLKEARSKFGFADTDHNRELLTSFLIKEHGGKFSAIAGDHFIRVHSGEIDRLAKPEARVDQRRQDPAHGSIAEREERKRQIAEHRNRFETAVQTTKDRATFEGQMKAIRRYVVMARLGPDYSASVNERIQRLEALQRRFPAYEVECSAEIARQQQTLRF